jgi:hypothetical protein
MAGSANKSSDALTGGCQCGAVRFRAERPVGESSLCYCRMCQKAAGNVFGWFVHVGRERFRWTRGAPATFASSNVARRGFCAACGTPLTWEHKDRLEISGAAFDDPSLVAPTVHMVLARRYPWLTHLDGLEVRASETDAQYAEFMASVVSNQHPDHDTAAWPPEDGNE